MRTVIDLAKHSHTVTYEVQSYKANQFMLVPDTIWTLRSDCSECGWFHIQTITNRGENPFTQYHRDFALMKHHLGIGFFAIPKTDGVGNDMFIREEDGSYWRLTYNKGDWERTLVTEEGV